MRAGFGLLVVIFLLIGVGGGAAFGGGVLYGRNTAPKAKAAATTAPAAPGSAAALAQGVAGAVGTPGAGGRGQGGGGGTAGSIDTVSGNTLTVRTQQGATTTVNLSADTRILTTAAATRDDLKPGSTVTVLGQPDAGGAITATTITIVPSGLVPAAQGGAQGTPGGGRGQGARPAATP